jgi:NitT/TauT family transport system substrate-binding protein
LLAGDAMYLDQQVAVLLYGPDFVNKRADVARRFMVAYLKGVRDYDNAFGKNIGRAEIVAILSKNTTVKKPELYEKMTMPGLDPDGAVNLDGMKADMQWFLSKGFLKEPVDVTKVVDASFVEFALKELGRYR